MYYELDPQGRFAERYWDDGRGECVNGYPILQNDCDVYRKCGAFGVCDSTKRPICSCLKGFQPKSVEEWCRGNWNSGCVRTTHLQCQRDDNNGSEAGQNDGFLKMKMMKVPAFPDRSSIIYGGCGDRCMKNCSCVAYAYDAGIGCMFWGGDLTDLQKFPFRGVDLYIRLPSSEFGMGIMEGKQHLGFSGESDLGFREFAKDRPNMSTVVLMLNSETLDVNPPKQPAFTTTPTTSQDVEHNFSFNDATLAHFDGP
ncbi:hypothetical protein V6N13_012444 [Hibiscus sabdariffa]